MKEGVCWFRSRLFQIFQGESGECNSSTILRLCCELAMVQVIFAGTGMTTHMCPENEVEKIPNLLVSLNESGCTTGDTLFAAYNELSTIIATKREEKGK